MPSQFYIAPFNATLAYKRYDAIYGIDIGGNIYASPYFYATADVVAGYSPSGVYNFPITQYSRADDVTTLTYTHTGGPAFGVGAIISVTGVGVNPSVNYTGMIIGGGSGSIQFINPGYPQTAALTAGAIHCLSPAWTTGFAFVPDYTSKIPSQNQAITTQLGNGYVQSMPIGLNTFNQNPSFVYRNIDKREMKAIVNFVQNTAGAYPFEVLTNDAFLNNQPNQKFSAQSVDVEPASFGLYNVSVSLTRRFDL